ncbi:MAG: hypothetical protein KDI51_01930 [Xanthomonadales bacterium]|nr:hypothetical protein [Xanthomonadales bacterium]
MARFRLALFALSCLLLSVQLHAQQVASPERLRELVLEMMEETGQMAALRRDHARYGEIFREIAASAGVDDAESWAQRIDALFPQQQIEQAVDELLRDENTLYMIEFLLELSRDADLRQALRWINGADPRPARAEPDSDKRQKLISALLAYGRFELRTHWQQKHQEQFVVAVINALDPTAHATATISGDWPMNPDITAIRDQWVKPATAAVSDQTLQDLTMRISTPPVDAYLAAAARWHGTYDSVALDALLLELQASRIDSTQVAQGPALTGQIAEARRLYFVDASPMAQRQANEALAGLNAAHPNHAEILTLLARIELANTSIPNAGSFALRIPNFDAPLDRVEQLVERALKADPDFAEALVLKAWTRFLDSKDAEVAELLARAEQIDPQATWLRANQADLATVQGRNDEAIAGYRAVLDQPEKERYLHLIVLRRSWVAHAQAGRLKDWEALARTYMERRSDDPYLPLFYAEHLLKTRQDPDAAIAMAKRSHDRANPLFRDQMIGAAEWIKAHQLREKSGGWSTESTALLEHGKLVSRIDATNLIGYVCGLHRSVETLLLLSERPEVGEDGKRALFACALQTRDPRRIGYFAQIGIDLNAPLPPTPWSPLEYTWIYEDPATFQALLAAGADPGRPSSNGQKSIEAAVRASTAADSPFIKALDANKR